MLTGSGLLQTRCLTEGSLKPEDGEKSALTSTSPDTDNDRHSAGEYNDRHSTGEYNDRHSAGEYNDRHSTGEYND